MENNSYGKIIVDKQTTIIQVLRKMDAVGHKSLLVYEANKFYTIVTIGEVQRAIIDNADLNSPIANIVGVENKKYAYTTDSIEKIRACMLNIRAEMMPVFNEQGELEKVLFWDDVFDSPHNDYRSINLPVVIMAGGKGSRLAPLTNVYPKPIIPVGEKTIIETIMDRFVKYNCHDFHISVNYKADTIKRFFDELDNREYDIHYFQEDCPMGTAGSLKLLQDKIRTTFIVSNCDIVVEEDYHSIVEYHRSNNNELTVVAALKTYDIPYGTINTSEEGLLESIEEKPMLSFKINTGFYVLEPSVFESIPYGFFHITDLMTRLRAQGRRVGVYPISQNDWQDMGDWDEYLKMIKVR